MMYYLSDRDVFLAIDKAVMPYTNYIGNYLRRQNLYGVDVEKKTQRRLKRLHMKGHIEQVTRFARGAYGHEWRVTDLGRAYYGVPK